MRRRALAVIRRCRSKWMPLTMKKMGTRKPKPMAWSLLSTTLLSSPDAELPHHDAGGEGAEEHVETELKAR